MRFLGLVVCELLGEERFWLNSIGFFRMRGNYFISIFSCCIVFVKLVDNMIYGFFFKVRTIMIKNVWY